MANQTRYVSPTGNQPAGYDAYYTTVNSAVAAVLSGDEVVLEMSTAHVWETGVVTRSGAQLFVIRNELNNDDYDACVVTVADNAQFVYSNSTANRSHAVFRGVTFAGPEGDYAEYDAGTVTGFLKMSSQCGANIIFKNVAFRRFKWVSEGGTGVRALTMAIAPTINAYHRTKLVVQDCVFTDMRSVGAITGDWPRVLLVRDCDAVFERCRFEDFGSTDRTSGCDVRTDSNEQTDFNVRFKDCHWLRINCEQEDPSLAGGPDGSAMCSSFVEHAFKERAFFQDCTFTECRSGKSGAVHIGRNSAGIFWRCKFTDCHASGVLGGGATGRGGNDNANMLNGWSRYYMCDFVRCTAAASGGAFTSQSVNLQTIMEHCSFDSCAADETGGVIYCPDLTSAISTDLFVIRNSAVTALAGAAAAFEGGGEGDNFGEVTNCYLPNGTADMLNVNGTVTGLRSGSDSLAGGGAHLGYRLGYGGKLLPNPPPIGAFVL